MRLHRHDWLLMRNRDTYLRWYYCRGCGDSSAQTYDRGLPPSPPFAFKLIRKGEER